MHGRSTSGPGTRWLPLWRLVGVIFVAYPIVLDHRRAARADRRRAGPVGDGDLRIPDRRPGTARTARSTPRRGRPILAALDVAIIVLATATVVRLRRPGLDRALLLRLDRRQPAPPGTAGHRDHRRRRRHVRRRACRLGGPGRARSSRDCPSRSSGSPCSRWPRCGARTPTWSRPARSWPHWPSPRSAIGSLATCMTCSVTACPSSRSRASSPADSCRAIPSEPAPRSLTSSGSPARPWRPCARPSAATASRPSSASWRTRRSCSMRPGSSRRSTTVPASSRAEDAVLAWAVREASRTSSDTAQPRHGDDQDDARRGRRRSSRSSTMARLSDGLRRLPRRRMGPACAGLRERLEHARWSP